MTLNLTFKRGRTYTFSGTVTKNGVVENLTGASLKFAAKYDLTDSDESVVFSCLSAGADGITVTDAVNGAITVVIDANKTAGLPAVPEDQTLFYELVYKTSSSKYYTILDGKIVLQPSVFDPF